MPSKTPSVREVLEEFVRDVQASHGKRGEVRIDVETLDWPDLAVTYRKALKALKAPPTQAPPALITRRLAEKVQRIMELQHSGGVVLAEDWKELRMLVKEALAKPKGQSRVWILWGEDRTTVHERLSPAKARQYAARNVDEYVFDSEWELNAFLRGIVAGEGWTDHIQFDTDPKHLPKKKK